MMTTNPPPLLTALNDRRRAIAHEAAMTTPTLTPKMTTHVHATKIASGELPHAINSGHTVAVMIEQKRKRCVCGGRQPHSRPGDQQTWPLGGRAGSSALVAATAPSTAAAATADASPATGRADPPNSSATTVATAAIDQMPIADNFQPWIRGNPPYRLRADAAEQSDQRSHNIDHHGRSGSADETEARRVDRLVRQSTGQITAISAAPQVTSIATRRERPPAHNQPTNAMSVSCPMLVAAMVPVSQDGEGLGSGNQRPGCHHARQQRNNRGDVDALVGCVAASGMVRG